MAQEIKVMLLTLLIDPTNMVLSPQNKLDMAIFTDKREIQLSLVSSFPNWDT